MVVFVTVCLSIPFKESRCAQLCFTNPTHKVLRVPHFTQCSDHLEKGNDDRNDSHVVEISQKSNEIKKKRYLRDSIWTHLVIPDLYLSHNGFVAESAVTFGCSANTNLLHVRAQSPQQGID